MKKKIMAMLAVIAAVLGFGFATNTAMADDYGATVTYSGTTATVTFPYNIPRGLHRGNKDF